MNAQLKQQALDWFKKHNIETITSENFIGVNRTSMMNSKFAPKETDEGKTYTAVIYALSEEIDQGDWYRFYWCSRDDDYLWLSTYRGS